MEIGIVTAITIMIITGIIMEITTIMITTVTITAMTAAIMEATTTKEVMAAAEGITINNSSFPLCVF
jgi:hypothetical protein